MRKLGFLLFMLLMSLLYYGLAVLGWGSLAAFISHPQLDALVLLGIFMTIVAIFTEGNLSRGIKEDRGNRWVLSAFTVIGVLSGWLPAYTDRMNIWTLGGDAVRWTGVALFALGGALRIWPVFVLGRRFSGLVAIQPGHTLCTTGIYARIRNPSYAGLLISTAGWALGFRSGPGLMLAALFIPPLIARMHAEERLLRGQFGEEYDAYFKRTWRLVPWLY
jgi:protein-S-isoprenylcysteine O-methyltransferase Ste14